MKAPFALFGFYFSGKSVLYRTIPALCLVVFLSSCDRSGQSSSREIAEWKAQNTYQVGESFRDCAECPEMVILPEGEFVMGDREIMNVSTLVDVSLDYEFAIGKYEVTIADWKFCVEDEVCPPLVSDYSNYHDGHPIMEINKQRAEVYIAWLNEKVGETYRLPSNAEWEYAARAGTTTAYPWGDEISLDDANYCPDCLMGTGGRPTEVGSYAANAFGLYDTAGNVYEVVSDCWRENYSNHPRDGSPLEDGFCDYSVMRGGSFGSDGSFLRSASRQAWTLAGARRAMGFRLARDIEKP